jgi:hypothetical protein
VSRPHMRFVPIKEVEHQDVQALHRARQLPVFSANTPPAHAHEKGWKSFAGAGLRADAGG